MSKAPHDAVRAAQHDEKAGQKACQVHTHKLYTCNMRAVSKKKSLGKVLHGLSLVVQWTLLATWPAATVSAQQLLVVADVVADVSADTAAQARDIAIENAQTEALRKLLRRFLSREDVRLISLTPDIAASLIADFSIQQEKISAKRYTASFTFRFPAEPFKAWMERNALHFSQEPTECVIVIPLLRVDRSAYVLWSDLNPWREAWIAGPVADPDSPYIVPLGDIQDVAEIPVEKARVADWSAVTKTVRRYDCPQLLVAQAHIAPDFLEVRARKLRPRGAQETAIIAYPYEVVPEDPDNHETRRRLLREAAFDIAALIEDWEKRSFIPVARGTQERIALQTDGLEQALALYDQIRNLPAVRDARFLSFSNEKALLEVELSGTMSNLRKQMQDKGIDLQQQEQAWVISWP